jgi:hypothetical protein
MKKFLPCAALIAALATPALADEWIDFDTTTNSTEVHSWSIERNSIQVNGDTVRFWLRDTNKKSGRSRMDARVSAQCGGDSVTVLTAAFYNAAGEVTGDTESPTTIGTPPGSVYARAVKAICDDNKK